jgi:hypothetical protein
MSFDSPLPPYNASDPTATFLNSSCLDLLLIELVPMAYRLANELQPSDRDLVAGGAGKSDGEKRNGSLVAGSGVGSQRPASKMDEDEERDAVFYRLEMLGYRVGQGLVERYVCAAVL